MSVTKSEPKSTRKASRKPAKTQETVLSALLAQTEEVSVPLASLIKCIPCQVTATVSPQVVADWQHSTCWQSVASFRLTGLSA